MADPVNTLLTIVLLEDTPEEREKIAQGLRQRMRDLRNEVGFEMLLKVEQRSATQVAEDIAAGAANPTNHLYIVDIFMPDLEHGAFELYDALQSWRRTHQSEAVRLLMVTAYLKDLEGKERYDQMLREQELLRDSRWCFSLPKSQHIAEYGHVQGGHSTWDQTVRKAIKEFSGGGWLGSRSWLAREPLLQGAGGRRLLDSIDRAIAPDTWTPAVLAISSDRKSLETYANCLRLARGDPDWAGFQEGATLESEIARLFEGTLPLSEGKDLLLLHLPVAWSAQPVALSNLAAKAYQWVRSRQSRQVLFAGSKGSVSRVSERFRGTSIEVPYAEVHIPPLKERREDWKVIGEKMAGRVLDKQATVFLQQVGLDHDLLSAMKALQLSGETVPVTFPDLLRIDRQIRPRRFSMTVDATASSIKIVMSVQRDVAIAHERVELAPLRRRLLAVLALAMDRAYRGDPTAHQVSVEEFCRAHDEVTRAVGDEDGRSWVEAFAECKDLDPAKAAQAIDKQVNAIRALQETSRELAGDVTHLVSGARVKSSLIKVAAGNIVSVRWFDGPELAFGKWDVSRYVDFIESRLKAVDRETAGA